MEILAFLFGNVLAAYKHITDEESQKTVDNLNQIFYQSFKETVGELEADNKIEAFQFEELIRLEKQEFISIISQFTENGYTLQQILVEKSLINRLWSKLQEISPNYPSIDSNISKELIFTSIDKFQKKVFYALSTKQGIYFTLKNLVKTDEKIDELKNSLGGLGSKIDSQSQKIDKQVEILYNQSTKIDKILQAIEGKGNDEVKQILSPIIDQQLKEAEYLAKEELNYQKAKDKYLYTVELLKEYLPEGKERIYQTHKELAFCCENLMEYKESAKWKIEGLEYNMNDKEAIFLAWMGNLVLNNIEESERLYQDLRLSFPKSSEAINAQIIKLARAKNIEGFKILYESIPQNTIEEAETCDWIASYYLAINDFEKYVEFEKKSIEKSSGKFKASKQVSLAHQLHFRHTYIIKNHEDKSFSKEVIDFLNQAISLYQEAWEYFKNRQDNRLKDAILINISTIYASLKDYATAEIWLEKMLAFRSSNYARYHKIMFLKKSSKTKEAIQECEKIHNIMVPENESILIFYIELLSNSDNKQNIDKAIVLAKKLVDSTENDKHKISVSDYLFSVLMKENRISEAKDWAQEQLLKKPTEIAFLLNQIEIYRYQNEVEKIKEILDQIVPIAENNTDTPFLSRVIEELIEYKRFQEAIKILESTPELYESISYLGLLVECFFKLGEKDKALEICQYVRTKYGFQRFFFNTEIKLYDFSKDYNKITDVLHFVFKSK